MNTIYLNNITIKDTNSMLVSIEKRGKYSFFIFSDGKELMLRDFYNTPICITCQYCSKVKTVNYYSGLVKKKYKCIGCNVSGKNNPFYGRHHSEESKSKIGGSVVDYKGKNNPFYGRHHSEENKKYYKKLFGEMYVGDGNPFYGKQHSDMTKEKISKSSKKMWDSFGELERVKYLNKLSMAQKILMCKDPVKYSENKSKAARCSHLSQFSKKKMNKIETKINEELKRRNIEMEYSVIFCYKQFDFGNKETKTLLEVHGDYWHGNPLLYGTNEGLKPLNNIQINKIEIDKDKENLAEKYGFKLFKIWESDINNGNFSILDKIKEHIDKCKKGIF